jgi:hypothetical protein
MVSCIYLPRAPLCVSVCVRACGCVSASVPSEGWMVAHSQRKMVALVYADVFVSSTRAASD